MTKYNREVTYRLMAASLGISVQQATFDRKKNYSYLIPQNLTIHLSKNAKILIRKQTAVNGIFLKKQYGCEFFQEWFTTRILRGNKKNYHNNDRL